jgi:hypothetical protein
MRTEQEIAERIEEIRRDIMAILTTPGPGGNAEYNDLYRERAVLEWVLGAQR